MDDGDEYYKIKSFTNYTKHNPLPGDCSIASGREPLSDI
jgi:hypothetical protein